MRLSTLAMRKHVLLTLLAVGMAGCVPAIRMTPSPLAPAASDRGSVDVGEVRNLRPEDEGRQDFKVLGRVRGGFGNPFALNTESGKELDVVLRETASDALRHAGYATEGKGTRRLGVEVLKFWCDGYTGYKIDSIIVAKLMDAPSGRVLVQKQMQVTQGFAIIAGYGSMRDAFNTVIGKIRSEMVSFINSEEFQSAAK